MANTVVKIFDQAGAQFPGGVTLDLLNNADQNKGNYTAVAGMFSFVMPTADPVLRMRFTETATGKTIMVVPKIHPATATNVRYEFALEFA